MIKLMLLLSTVLSGTPNNLEQKACDYFFANIFKQEYQGYKVFEFQNQTDTAKYWGTVHQCARWDQETKAHIVSATPGRPVIVNANRIDLKAKRIRKNSGRLKVYVYSSIKVGDNYFVAISTYRKLRFTEYFFIKFDKAGNIMESCKTGEII